MNYPIFEYLSTNRTWVISMSTSCEMQGLQRVHESEHTALGIPWGEHPNGGISCGVPMYIYPIISLHGIPHDVDHGDHDV